MISCLVIDDEPFAVQLLEDYIQRTDFLNLAQSFHHPMEAIAWLRQNHADIVFLDIEMPKLTGMELSSFLPRGQKLVFTTAYAQYAVESYDKNASDYLLKPITYERFLKTARQLQADLLQTDSPAAYQSVIPPTPGVDFIFAKTGRAIVKIVLDEIVFVEHLKDCVTIYTNSERHVVNKRMKEIEELLPGWFQRSHLSYIVNLRKIQAIEDNLVCIGAKRIPIGGKYQEPFMSAIRTHLM